MKEFFMTTELGFWISIFLALATWITAHALIHFVFGILWDLFVSEPPGPGQSY